MKIYSVDYLIVNEARLEEYKNGKFALPRYVVAPNFKTAYNKAVAFEEANVALHEIKLATPDGHVVLAEGFTALGNIETPVKVARKRAVKTETAAVAAKVE